MKFSKLIAISIIVVAAACAAKKEAPAPSRKTVAIKYAAADLQIREAPRDDAPLVTTYRTGEAVSILGEKDEWSEIKLNLEKSGWAKSSNLVASKTEVGSTPEQVRFRIAPEPVSQPGLHGLIRLEATVNVHGDVTGVKRLENTTGRSDIERLTIESLRKAKFYPLLQNGKAEQFIYEYTATF